MSCRIGADNPIVRSHVGNERQKDRRHFGDPSSQPLSVRIVGLLAHAVIVTRKRFPMLADAIDAVDKATKAFGPIGMTFSVEVAD
jgi:hypothetical protein